MIIAGSLFVVGGLFNAARAYSEGLAGQGAHAAGTYSGVGLQIVLGCALLQGSEGARKFVLWCAGLVAVAALVFTGAFAREMGLLLAGFLVSLSSAAVFGLLFGSSPGTTRLWATTAALLLAWSASLTLPWWSRPLLDAEGSREIARWTAPERLFEDREMGLKVQTPSDWVILKKDNELLTAPDGAVLLLAHSTGAAFAILMVEEIPTGIGSVNEYIEALVALRRRNEPTIREEGRSETLVGSVSATRVSTSWSSKGFPLRGSTLVWRDEARFFSLTAWSTASRAAEGLKQLATIEEAVTFLPRVGAAVTPAGADTRIDPLLADVPHLSRSSLALLIKKTGGQPLTAAEAFREGHRWGTKGLTYLKPEELQEMGKLTQVVYGSLSERDRTRLGAYLEQVRAGAVTQRADDEAMSLLMKRAVGALPPDSRTRLQGLLEQAILMGTLG